MKLTLEQIKSIEELTKTKLTGTDSYGYEFENENNIYAIRYYGVERTYKKTNNQVGISMSIFLGLAEILKGVSNED